MAGGRSRIFYLEFIAALILYTVYIAEYLAFTLYYYEPAVVYTILFAVYATFYVMHREKPETHAAVLHLMFALLVVLFAGIFIVSGTILASELIGALNMFKSTGLYIIFLILPYFIFALAAYAYLVARKRGAAVALVALGFAITMIIFFYVIVSYRFGDEVLLGFNAVLTTLRGGNPYTTSIGNQLYANFTTVGGVVTTNNKFVGYMDYPALYFVSFMPFYFISPPTWYNIGHIDLNAQAGVFLDLLLLSMVFVLDRRKILQGRLEVIAFLALTLAAAASVTTFIMLAIMLIAYMKIESRYAFIPIGLALSIQEQIWLPAGLLLIYSLNNYGWKKGLRDIAGAAAVFAAINGYFIFLNPHAFFYDVFKPLGNIVPFNSTPFASLLIYNYHVALSLSGILVALSSVAMVLLLLYWNRKELIPLFGLIPLFFVFHSLPAYYTFYFFFLVYVIAFETRRSRTSGMATRFLRRNRYLFFALLAVVVAMSIAFAYISNASYARDFNLSVENQSISFIGNSTVYKADISYSDLSNSSVYFYIQGYSSNGSVYTLYGIDNDSLIGLGPSCTDYTCKLNLNRLNLTGSGSYSLRAVINGSNESARVTYLHAIFYSGQYVYETKPVQSSG